LLDLVVGGLAAFVHRIELLAVKDWWLRYRCRMCSGPEKGCRNEWNVKTHFDWRKQSTDVKGA